MRKESQHYQRDENLIPLIGNQCQEPTTIFRRQIQIKSKNDFLEWLKSLPFQIRYLAVKVQAPSLAQTIRQTLKRFQFKNQNLEAKKATNKYQKNILDSIVFTSDGKQFFDSICFQFNYIEYPERLYELLMYNGENIKKFNPIQEMEKNRKQIKLSCQQIRQSKSKEQLCRILIKVLRHQVFFNTCNKQEIQINSQKNRKKQLSFYWRNLSEQHKQKILYLKKRDLKELCALLIEQKISLQPQQLQRQIALLMKLQKNQFCNRIFKCKLKKSLSDITDYHALVYKFWKSQYQKYRKNKNKKSLNNSINKNIYLNYIQQEKYQKVKLKQQKKLKIQNQKENSIDSFQTNQTQIYQKLEETVIQKKIFKDTFLNDFIEKKIYKNIVQISNYISQQANKYHKSRLIAFQRIKFILQLYRIPIKLFGSCANGIAIKNSDVDIAIDNSILNYFPYCQATENKIIFSLQWLKNIFLTFKCMKNVKFIESAHIPIIKLSLDTKQLLQIDQSLLFVDISQYLNYLNRPHKSSTIQIDITIQTQSQNLKCNHLGINTTKRINQWIQEIKNLKHLIIIFKYFLNLQNLNSTYKDGINTYGMVVMMVAVIRQLNLQKEENIIIMFEKILNFIVHEFDQKTYGIDLRNKKQIFYKKSDQSIKSQTKFMKAQLQILDPENGGYNMTKKCYKFQLIKQLFQKIQKQCFNNPRKQIISNFLKDTKLIFAKIQNQKVLKQESLSRIAQSMQNPFMKLIKEKNSDLKTQFETKQEEQTNLITQFRPELQLLKTDSISG